MTDDFDLAVYVKGDRKSTAVFDAQLVIEYGDQVTDDADGDGIPDSSDNCTLVANADQRDTDGDGYGNICDADLNNDLQVDFSDLTLFQEAFNSATLVPDADFNGDDMVDSEDLDIFNSLFFQPPGPSCIDLPGGCV